MAATSLQDRLQIYALATTGATDAEIAQRLRRRPATVRKWRRRLARTAGRDVASRLGRPPTGPLSSFAPAVTERVTAWHQAHPRWGATTLRAELVACADLTGQRLPSRATLARWLTATGTTRPYDRQRPLPTPPVDRPDAPHQRWELDGYGHQLVPAVGVISLLNLTDTVSRLKLLSYPCWLGAQRAQRHPTTADYQLVLRLAFTRWGLPDRLAVDRDSVYYDNQSGSPYPTLLHQWLLALGIAVEIGPPGRPTVRARIERSHQLWDQQVLAGQTFPDLASLRAALDARATFLNTHLPCASLDDRPPLVAYPEAGTPRRAYRPEWEATLLDVQRVVTYLGQGEWFRRVGSNGMLQLGGQGYYLGTDWVGQQVRLSVDPAPAHLLVERGGGTAPARLPLKGVTPAVLLGDLQAVFTERVHQLAFPVSWLDHRAVRLYETLPGTT